MLLFIRLIIGLALIGLVTPVETAKPEPVAVELPQVQVAPVPEPDPEPEPEPVAPLPKEPQVVVPAPAPVIGEQSYELPLTIAEYIAKNKGICPSQQEVYRGLTESWGPSATMGLDAPYPSPLHFIEAFWAQRHRDNLHGTWSVIGFSNLGIPDPRGRIIYANEDTLEVWWEGPSDPAREAEWNAMTAEMQAHLREIEYGYQALCPGE